MDFPLAALVVLALALIVLGVVVLATGWEPPFARSRQVLSPRVRGLVVVAAGINALIQAWRLSLDQKSFNSPGSRVLHNVSFVSGLVLVGIMLGVFLIDRRRRRGSWTRAGAEMTKLVVATLAGMYVLVMIVLAVVFS